MNQTTFEALINDSELLNKETLSELEELVNAYPFCQTFHLLYTRNLFQQKHIRYNQQLKVAAAVVGDRTRLKHYIENAEFFTEKLREKPVHTDVFAADFKQELNDEVIEVRATETSGNVGQDEHELTVVQDSASGEDIASITAPTETVYHPEDGKPSSSKSVGGYDASEAPLSSSFDASISREEKKKAIIAMINKKFSEREVENEILSAEKNTAENVEITPPTINREELHNVSELIIEDDKVTVSEALDFSDRSTSGKDLSVEVNIEKVDLDYLEGYAVTDDNRIPEVKIPDPIKKEVVDSDVLIENFLRDAPRISRPKKEFFNPVNLAARSIIENEDFYTETYATICLKQGNVSKAVKIYEKLSLKFPEKSSYFAGLIEKINKEQNI